jgi:hypothetical protein
MFIRFNTPQDLKIISDYFKVDCIPVLTSTKRERFGGVERSRSKKEVYFNKNFLSRKQLTEEDSTITKENNQQVVNVEFYSLDYKPFTREVHHFPVWIYLESKILDSIIKERFIKAVEDTKSSKLKDKFGYTTFNRWLRGRGVEIQSITKFLFKKEVEYLSKNNIFSPDVEFDPGLSSIIEWLYNVRRMDYIDEQDIPEQVDVSYTEIDVFNNK